MKSIFRFILILSLIISPVVFSGCKTTSGQSDVVKIAKVKAAVEPVVSSIVRRVALKNPEYAVYMRSAGGIFCAMRDNKNFSPAYLVDELNKIKISNNPDIVDAKNLIVALYKIYYADKGHAEIDENSFLGILTDIFCNSINQGLKDAGF